MTTTSENLQLVFDTLESSNEIAPVLSAAEQCFIKRNLTMFSNASRTTTNPYGWDSFLSLHDDDTEALVSKLTSGGSNNKNILRLTTLEKANLVPKVLFYKVIRDPNTGKSIREIPIAFPDSAKTNIDAMLASKSQRGDDIAIKSFTFDFKNQNPFGAGRIVDCTLVLTMLNGESLVKERGIAGGNKSFKFSDLIVRNNRLNPEEFNSAFYEIKANVGYEIPRGNDAISFQLQGDLENMQLSMILSLMDYDLTFGQNGTLTLTLSYRSRIEEALSSPRKYNLFVDTVFDASSTAMKVKSKAEIRKDKERIATLEKSKETVRSDAESALRDAAYAGQFNGIVRRQDYVSPEQKMKKKKEIEQQKEYLLQEIQIQITGVNGKIEKTKTEILYMANKNRVGKYNTLLENMFKAQKIRKLVVPRQGLMMYGEAFDESFEKVAEGIMSSRTSPLDFIDNVGEIGEISTEAQEARIEIENSIKDQVSNTASSKKNTGADIEGDLNVLALEEAQKNGRSVANQADFNAALPKWKPPNSISDAQTSARNEKIIYWFYYGDLLDHAFKMNDVHQQMYEDRIVPTIGPIRLADKNGTYHTVNIADIPITLNTFLEFFKTNVLDLERDVYAASDFIRDTIQRLIMPCLNGRCFGNDAKDPKTLKITTFELPTKKTNGKRTEPLTNGNFGNTVPSIIEIIASPLSATKSYSARLDLDSVMDKNKKTFGNYKRLASMRVDQRYSYLLFYGNSKESVLNWKGDESKDRKKGIYHFWLGSDRGLVNQINFQKQQDGKVAMVMAERAMKAGKDRIELWRNFTASISTIGNTLVKPGCFLYINPSIAGLGDIKKDKNSLARQMGLGGYYMVLGVSNTIDDSGWRTNISAVWQSAPPLQG